MTPRSAGNSSRGENIPGKKRRFRLGLSSQVLVAMAIANVFGYFSPEKAAAMKPLGDAFIRLITMIITLVIFCTVSRASRAWRT